MEKNEKNMYKKRGISRRKVDTLEESALPNGKRRIQQQLMMISYDLKSIFDTENWEVKEEVNA